MSLSNALQSSVSGLNTTSTAISVIGNNIANVNTTGFKEQRAEFSNVLGQTLTGAGGFSSIGAGAKLSQISTIFTQGTFESTSRPSDLAIQGQGFFILDSSQGRSFSRAGIFEIDNQGTLVSPTGQHVQGFGIDPATGSSNGQLGDITLSTAFSPPNPSSLLDISLNLDPAATIIPGGFDPTDPVSPATTANFNQGMTFFDSLGNSHFATLRFNRTGSGTWDYVASLDTADTTTAPLPGATDVIQGGGTLSFDTSGNLTAITGSTIVFEFSGGVVPSQAITINFGPIAGIGTGGATSSFGGESSTNSFNADGFAAGSLRSYDIDREGFMTGQFSNGETIALAQVALASFPNVEGLNPVGNGNIIDTRESGQALIGTAGSGSFGSIRAGSLEQSNVDLAAQFVKLIVNQRAFQANTRTVSTANELMANLVSLGQ